MVSSGKVAGCKRTIASELACRVRSSLAGESRDKDTKILEDGKEENELEGVSQEY